MTEGYKLTYYYPKCDAYDGFYGSTWEYPADKRTFQDIADQHIKDTCFRECDTQAVPYHTGIECEIRAMGRRNVARQYIIEKNGVTTRFALHTKS